MSDYIERKKDGTHFVYTNPKTGKSTRLPADASAAEVTTARNDLRETPQEKYSSERGPATKAPLSEPLKPLIPDDPTYVLHGSRKRALERYNEFHAAKEAKKLAEQQAEQQTRQHAELIQQVTSAVTAALPTPEPTESERKAASDALWLKRRAVVEALGVARRSGGSLEEIAAAQRAVNEAFDIPSAQEQSNGVAENE